MAMSKCTMFINTPVGIGLCLIGKYNKSLGAHEK
jgi:hypothetical protein